MNRLALCLFLFASAAFSQAISNPSNPTNNPNQINVTTTYLYLAKMHYAGTWSSTATYNSQDVVLYSGAAYISLQAANLNQNPASAALWWVVIPGSGGGGGSWGSITGTLSDQTDLASALAGKQATLGYTPLNPASNLSDLGSAPTARTNLGLGTAAVAAGPAGAIVGTTDTQTLTNKSIAGSEINSGTLPHAQLPALLSADIPNNAANTSGNATSATALAATPSLCTTGQAPTGVLANGNATGCASAAGGAFSASLGSTGSVAVSTSPTTLFSVSSVPALAAGTCYNIELVAGGPATPTSLAIYVDSTNILTVLNSQIAVIVAHILYCNNAGSQTAQTTSLIAGGYSTANSGTTGLTNYYIPSPYATPTGVNWATSHTVSVSITATGVSTFTGMAFRIGQ